MIYPSVDENRKDNKYCIFNEYLQNKYKFIKEDEEEKLINPVFGKPSVAVKMIKKQYGYTPKKRKSLL